MIRHMRLLPVLFVAVVALVLAVAAPEVSAQDELEAQVLIEINAFDGDAGFQGEVDGEPWKLLKLTGPDGKVVMKVQAPGHNDLAAQGLTEYVWESGEPQFDEQRLAVTLERFPEGDYIFEAKMIDGGKSEAEATLSHVLPDPPCIEALTENGCVDPTANLIVMFDQVTTQFTDFADKVYPQVCPNDGDLLPPEDAIEKYIVVVEFEDKNLTVEILADACIGPCQATIPMEFLDPDMEGKVEVLAVSANGNRTSHEATFETCD